MENKKIALIDADSIIYSAFHGNKVSDDITGEPLKVDGKLVLIPKTDEEIKESLDSIFNHIFKEGEFTHYLIFVRGENCRKDRLSYNPDYKANRIEKIPEKWEFTKQYAIDKWKAIPINDLEVDDAIRICSINIPNSHIVAIDKDLLWLRGTNFNWRKNEWTIVDKDQEEEYLAKSLICGDTSDNIKGIPGKGKSFCEKNNIKTISDAFNIYIKMYGLNQGVNFFYKNFKCLYILEYSDKYTNIPTPIKIEYNDNGENKNSRSATGIL